MLNLFGRRKGRNVSTIDFNDANKKRIFQRSRKSLVLLVVFVFACVGIFGVATFVNAKLKDGGEVTLSIAKDSNGNNKTSDYGDSGTYHYRVTRGSETYVATCAQPAKSPPAMGKHKSQVSDAPAGYTGSKYNEIKYLFVAYKYDKKDFFKKVKDEMNKSSKSSSHDNYSALHAVAAYAYGDWGDTAMATSSGYNWTDTNLEDVVMDTLTDVDDDMGDDAIYNFGDRSIPLSRFDVFVIKTSGKQDIVWVEPSPRAKVKIKKLDADTGTSTPSGNATSLAGATFVFYEDNNGVPGEPVMDANLSSGSFEYAGSLVSGANGETSASAKVFAAPGTYWVQETAAPVGYGFMSPNPMKFTISANDEDKTVTYTVYDSVIRSDVQLQKCDKDQPIVNGVCANDGSKQGDTDLSGIPFQIINRSPNSVYVDPDGDDTVANRQECKTNAVCATIYTNAAGYAATTNKTLPYGTYELKESGTNRYYLHTDTTSRTFSVVADGDAGISRFTLASTGDYSAEGDLYGSMFINEAIRGDLSVYKCDDELRQGSNGNGTANSSATRTCMPIGGADFDGIQIAIWNRSAKPVSIRGQQNNPQAKRVNGAAITGDFRCDPSSTYNVSEACMILTFSKNYIDSTGYYVKTDGKAFPVGHYEFREIDPEGRTSPHNYSNGKGYYLSDTQWGHRFSIDPTSNPSGWTQQPAASASGQTTNANQDGQRKLFIPKTYANGANDAALFNKARRGDIYFDKKIQDCADPTLNGSAMKFTPFLLISQTNGEAHILITNKNGIAGTGLTPDLVDDDYVSQKYKYHTNENDGVLGNQLTNSSSDCAKAVKAIKNASREDTAAARKANAKLVKAVQATCTITSANENTYLNDAHAQYRVWFGSDIKGNTAPVDNSRSGALPYDDYYLIELNTSKTEQLGLQLAASTVNVDKNGQNVDLGTIDDVPECVADCLIQLKKRSNPKSGTEVKRGDTITYYIDLKNIGRQDNEDYGVRDYIPVGTTYKSGTAKIASSACESSSTSDAHCRYNTSLAAGAAVDWQHLTIEAGQTLTISFDVTVNKDAPQVIVNQALGQDNWDKRSDPKDPTNEVYHYLPIEQGCVKITKWSDPTPSTRVVEGQEITYTLTVANTCATNRPYVQVRDYIPKGTTYKQGSVSNVTNAKGAYKSGSEPYVEWLLTNLAIGEERTTSFTVTVNQKHPLWIENTAFLDDFDGKTEKPGNPGSITSDPRTSKTGKQSNTVIHYFTGSPEIPPYPFLIKGSDPAPGSIVNPGDTITYRLTYYNLGTEDVNTAGIRDVIPEGTTYVDGSATDHGYYNKNQNSVDWKNLRIEAGKSITVSYQVKVSGAISDSAQAQASSHAAVKDCEGNTGSEGSGSGGNDGPRVIQNQALYAFNWNGQEDPSNKSNIVEHRKNITHGYCLTVRKESNPVSGSQVGVPGNTAGLPSEITYTLPATNTGAETVKFTRIRDYIPEGTVYKEGSVSEGGVYNKEGNYVEWVLKDIGAGVTNRSAYYTVTVEKDAQTNQAVLDHIYNTALYEVVSEDPGKPGDSKLPDPKKETNKTVHWTKTPPPCLLEGIKDSTPVPGSEVHSGDIITYHLTLKNNGAQACTKAMIRDVIPEYTSYVADSADTDGKYDENTNAVYWENLRVEPAGGTITVNFKVQVGAGLGKVSIFNQFDYGEGNLDSTSNIVEHITNLTPLVPKTGSERIITLATSVSGIVGVIGAALHFARRHFIRRSFRL